MGGFTAGYGNSLFYWLEINHIVLANCKDGRKWFRCMPGKRWVCAVSLCFCIIGALQKKFQCFSVIHFFIKSCIPQVSHPQFRQLLFMYLCSPVCYHPGHHKTNILILYHSSKYKMLTVEHNVLEVIPQMLAKWNFCFL